MSDSTTEKMAQEEAAKSTKTGGDAAKGNKASMRTKKGAAAPAKRKKKTEDKQDEGFQWCAIREGRVSVETCRHQAFVEGEPTCLRCLQQDLFAGGKSRPRARSRRKKT